MGIKLPSAIIGVDDIFLLRPCIGAEETAAPAEPMQLM
jgi:hypothetical protein